MAVSSKNHQIREKKGGMEGEGKWNGNYLRLIPRLCLEVVYELHIHTNMTISGRRISQYIVLMKENVMQLEAKQNRSYFCIRSSLIFIQKVKIRLHDN